MNCEKARREKLEMAACRPNTKTVMDLKPKSTKRSVKGVHYADYHLFREQQGPKTYREIEDYRKSFQDYQQKKNPAPAVALRA